METFISSFNAIMPLFIMIAAGYISKRVGIIKSEYVSPFNAVTFKVFFPVSIFVSITKSDLSNAIRPKLIVFVILGILFCFALSYFIARLVSKEKRDTGVIMQGIFRSNYAAVGLLIVSSLSNGADVSAAAVVLAVVVPIFNVLAVICLVIFNGEKFNLKKILLKIITNPLIIGSVLGLLFLLLKIHIPEILKTALETMGKVASPLSLFLLGAFFQFDTVKTYAKELVIITFARLIVFPGIIITVGYMLGFRNVELATLIGLFASSTAVNSFTMAQQMGNNAELAGDVVIVTSALCSFTILLWTVIFRGLGAV